jgi:hypothetical protein
MNERRSVDLVGNPEWEAACREASLSCLRSPGFEELCREIPEFREFCERQLQKGRPEQIMKTILLLGVDADDPGPEDVEGHLQWCERGWKEGHLEQLMNAVHLCRMKRERLFVPIWVFNGVLSVLMRVFLSSENVKYGGEATHWKDWVHTQRWHVAKKLYQEKKALQKEYTWLNAYEDAATILTRANGKKVGSDAVEKSYKRVQRAISNGNGARYLHMLGLG